MGRTAKLAPGVVHLIALAKIPGTDVDMSNDQLWIELTGSRYTTPLLRSWIPWLKEPCLRVGGLSWEALRVLRWGIEGLSPTNWMPWLPWVSRKATCIWWHRAGWFQTGLPRLYL